MSNSHRQIGFTLIEIVVALAILAVSLTALMHLFQSGMRGGSAAENRIFATLHAQTLLAGLGLENELVAGEIGGDIDDRFRWSTVIEPLESGVDAGDNQQRRVATATAYQVTVTVSWVPEEDARSVSLTTIDLAIETAAQR